MKIGFEAKFINIDPEAEKGGVINVLQNGAKRYGPIVNTDEQRIQQVLLGLQSNALKFTREGGVSILAEIITIDQADFL